MRTENGLTYLHSDHLGSTVLTTQGNTSTASQGYYAYGQVRDHSGEILTDHTFTGQKSDSATGLQYYNARYYDPNLGIFISPDTIVPDPGNVMDWNRYMYVRGNPMSYVDPTGHFCVPGFNVGTTCTESTNWDAVQTSLDAVGLVEPTPFADGTNTMISLVRGNYTDAGLSALGMIPYAGDLAKGGKYADEIYAGGKWVWKKGADLLGLSDEGAAGAAKAADCLLNSFSAKTLVMTARGLRPISELIEGDLVLAWDEATGKNGYFVVTDTISHLDPEITLLTLSAPELAEGGETLEPTADHPFYVVEGNAWLPLLMQGNWVEAFSTNKNRAQTG